MVFVFYIFIILWKEKKKNKIYGCFGWKNIVEYIIV